MMAKIIDNAKWFLLINDPLYDREALFRNIWREYSSPLLYFLRHYSPADAEDLLQEVMLKIFENLTTYNPLYSFRTWIYTIARNHALNHLKKRSTRDREHTDPIDTVRLHAAEDTAETPLIAAELTRIIDGVLSQLDAEQRQIAFLRFSEGLSYREIAQMLSIPAGTVKSRLHHIKKRLHERLEHYHAD